jgi:hypothetical protein
VATSAQSPGDFNSLRVLEGEYKKCVKRVRAEAVKLKRDSSIVNTEGSDPGRRSRQEGALE